MRATSITTVLAALCVVAACSQSPSRPSSVASDASDAVQEAQGGHPLTATVKFGQPDLGSPFAPPLGHDQSSHAKDNLAPRTVVIARGGTVTFDLSGPGRRGHQVVVFPDGTKPDDVDVTALSPAVAGCPPPHASWIRTARFWLHSHALAARPRRHASSRSRAGTW